MIELINLKKIYQSKDNSVVAVNGVNLNVAAGKIFGIIGLSGAGKSTLIRCVNFLEKPTSGEVVINGKYLSQLSSRELRQTQQKIGMIFQHFNLLNSRTVFANIALPLELAGKSKQDITLKVNSLLQLVDLTDKKNNYPSQLSGGQKQRVAIARALANDPEVLLCDEATSALDPQTTDTILSLLKQINNKLNITILLITHEMEVVKNICDQVAVIDQGKIIEASTVENFFLNPQTQLAQNFVRTFCNEKPMPEISVEFQPEYSVGKNLIVRLTFVGDKVAEPLVTKLAKKFNIDASILQADIETVNEKTMGFLVVELYGDKQKTTEFIDHLTAYETSVKAEVLGYAN